VIDFRYHVVSIVAVFLALALGLFIGSTTLRGTVASDLNRRTAAVKSENANLSGQVHDLNNQLNNANSFDTAIEPYAISSVLAGESVLLVSAPGVDDGTRNRLSDALAVAGATVSGDVRLEDNLLDPQQGSFLATLASKFSVPGITQPTGSGSERALGLLADVLGTKPQGHQVSPSAAGRVLSAFEAGKLISTAGSTTRPGALVVLLTPSPSANADPSVVQQQQTLLLTFAADLDRTSVGAVVAGPTDSGDNNGLVAAARHDNTLSADVSTVAGTDVASGVIATALALAEQARGGVGSYGGAGASAPVPTSSPSS
jgi:Copper transport outer membrane protein, MctB